MSLYEKRDLDRQTRFLSPFWIAPMPRTVKKNHRWAVVLAGGDGVRLRAFTRLVMGDDRPKQFCSFFGDRSLLTATRERINQRICANNSLFVLVRPHEMFYRPELKKVESNQMVEQPSNRGTLPAIVYGLLRTARLDPQGVVAFFPSDHHYSDESTFMDGIESAFECAEQNPHSIVLVAAPPKYPATDYGWIEVNAASPGRSTATLRGVKKFWEKPSLNVANALLNRGCVWNTFVMVGTAAAFEDAIRAAVPGILRAFDPLRNMVSVAEESCVAQEIYETLPSADFSQLVLSMVPERLGVFCLEDVGWSDLGNPERLVEVMAKTDETRDRLNDWRASERVSPARSETTECGPGILAASA
jgi:mannose-1-phosphate guanylyltransferase